MDERVRYSVNRPDVIDERFDEEFVIVNLRDGTYYGLNSIGTEVWEQLAAGASRAEMLAFMLAHYEAEPTQAAIALEQFLSELEREALIVQQSATGENALPNPASADSQTRLPFIQPTFEKFTDMREVLQLDPIHEVDDTGWPASKP